MQWPRGSETPELPIASNVGTMLWVSRYHLFQTRLLVFTDNVERVGQEKKRWREDHSRAGNAGYEPPVS